MVDENCDRVPVALYQSLVHVPSHQVCLKCVEVIRNVVIELKYPVPGLEAQVRGKLACVNPVLLVADVAGAPNLKHGYVQQNCKNEVVQHAAGHDQKPLPGLLGAELPGLGLPFQELLVHGFIYHAGNLAIAAQGQPANSVFCISLLEAEKLLPAQVKEQEELVHPYLEQFCKGEMACLVHKNKHGQGCNQL